MNNKCLRFLFSVPERTKTTKNNSQQPNTKWNKKSTFVRFIFAQPTNQPMLLHAVCVHCTILNEFDSLLIQCEWASLSSFFVCLFLLLFCHCWLGSDSANQTYTDAETKYICF